MRAKTIQEVSVSRHKARQQALELLFSREFHGENDIQYKEKEIFEEDGAAPDDAADSAAELGDGGDEGAYCDYLVQTVTAYKEELDGVIQSFAKGWNVSRMNHTDKNIMRLALCELVYPKEETAPSIVLNEAILLAKEYSGEKAAKFINGILGAYVRSRS
jgi:N utilization substance protein B